MRAFAFNIRRDKCAGTASRGRTNCPKTACRRSRPAQWLARNNGKWPAPELSIEVLLAESVLPAAALSSFGLGESLGNWDMIV